MLFHKDGEEGTYLCNGICPQCELKDKRNKVLTLGINNQTLSDVPSYRAVFIRSWRRNDKLSGCIICNYPLLVDNDEDPENGWINLQFTNVKCKI